MKILIINGYSKTYECAKCFAEYESLIRECFKDMKEMIDTEIEFLIRDTDTLDDLLYETDSSYVRHDSAKYFDQMDIIFFEGDANLRPWSVKAHKYLIFLRMCLRSNKILFASSFAMQALVFLIASNIETNINIVNGLNGGELGDLSKLNKNLKDLRSTDYFLDNVTGDLYGFNYDTGEWQAKKNAGIHYRRSAEEFKTIGKYILKAPTYKGNTLQGVQKLCVSKSNEIICYLKKNSMRHYLFTEQPFEFLVPFKNSWDVHNFNFVNPKKTFISLAESQKG